MVFHPGEERGAKVEADLGIVVDDLCDPAAVIYNPRCAIRGIALGGNALIPIVKRVGRRLRLNALQPRILPGRLVKMGMDADEAFFHGIRYRPELLEQQRVGCREGAASGHLYNPVGITAPRQGSSLVEISMNAGKTPFLLDGNWVDSGDSILIKSPFDQSVVGETFRATPAQLEQAITASVRAFTVTRELTSSDRQQVLKEVAEGIQKERDLFARTIALEAGKPIRTARAEVDRAIFTFTIAAEESRRIGGELLPMDLQPGVSRDRWAMVRRFPLGPVAAITPFNFPLNLVAHKLAPAIAAGCPVVLKPAPQTPLSALLLAKLIWDAGWPAGALNVLPLSNEDTGPLVSDDRLKLLSFTGSAQIGWELKSKAGKKKVALELGGNAGVIVHGDADIEDAAQRCAVGGFSYAGQSCISVQRIFVQRCAYQHFLDALLPKVRALKIGDPLDESTDVGPLIRESDARRVEAACDCPRGW